MHAPRHTLFSVLKKTAAKHHGRNTAATKPSDHNHEHRPDSPKATAGKSGADALALYSANRPGAEFHELVAAVETDRMFTIPAIRMADAQVRHNSDLWMYRFDWRTPARGGAFGAHHFLEVPFAFEQIDNPERWMIYRPEGVQQWEHSTAPRGDISPPDSR